MAERRPSFPFYPKDWLSSASVSSMPLAAQGLYVRLMSYAWQADGLPCSHEALRNLVGVSRAEWRKLWPHVSPMWCEENGKIFNRKLEAVRVESAAFTEAARAAGRASAAARAQRNANGTPNDGPREMATELPAGSQPASAVASSVAVLERATLARARAVGQQPDADWGGSPAKGVRAHVAWKASRDILDVPHDLYASLLSGMPTPDEPALLSWLTATDAAWQGRGVAQAYKFWRARADETWGADSGRTKPARVAGLTGGGVPASQTRASVPVIDPDYNGQPHRFHCGHTPTCATWPQCRDHETAVAS